MFCSICGARNAEGRTNCQACGAALARPSRALNVTGTLRLESPLGTSLAPASAAGLCPRCGFNGDGISYFSKGGHVAALVGLTVLTGGMMGAGGVGYYFLRRKHRICPRCGESWGEYGERATALAGPGGTRLSPRDTMVLESSGSGRSAFSMVLFVLAAFLFIVGMAAFEAVPLMFGASAAVGGWLLRKSAQEKRERRREALLEALQLPVLQLAAKRGGRLTVTDVVTEMGWPIPRAEKVLNSMEDGLRVISDITDEGVIVYDFPEIRLGNPQLLRGNGGTSPGLSLPAA
ncbi:MAG TPA: hypothetical protein VHG91_01945 [Longimicrobium sp.]|nr:hypothetical protein [Longimicrobium sp.]